jgi:Mg-chelatase subunit ChlD
MSTSLSVDERINGLSDDVREDFRRELRSLLRTLRNAGNPIGVIVAMSRLSLRLVGEILARAGHERRSDNLYDCIALAAGGDADKKIKGVGVLPAELASYLHTIRVFSNKADHDAERVLLQVGHAENALDQFLHVLEWFYCQYEHGPKLRTIYRKVSGDSPGDWFESDNLAVRLRAVFDQTGYWCLQDAVCRFLLEWEVRPVAGRSLGADVFLVLDVSGSMDQPDRYPLLRQAVDRFLRTMAPEDHVGIVLFSAGAEVTLPPTTAAAARGRIPQILQGMDQSGFKFAGATRLAPGLSAALELLRSLPHAGIRVQRVYVLTDGELHDSGECREVLTGFRPRKVEVHSYGFGTEFDAAALKRLLSDQLGGSVKPICNTQDIIGTFAHIATVNQRLAASEAMLTVEFDPRVACGDAWTFRPQERYLGAIKQRRLVREVGALESDRVYALLVEARLPAGDHARTAVARARLAWGSGESRGEHTVVIEAPRVAEAGPEACRGVPEVVRAYTLLDAMRQQTNPDAQLAALKARRELALLERRDPKLIAALDTQIDVFEGRASPAGVNEEVAQYVLADNGTLTEMPPEQELPRLKKLREEQVLSGGDPDLMAVIDRRIKLLEEVLSRQRQEPPGKF